MGLRCDGEGRDGRGATAKRSSVQITAGISRDSCFKGESGSRAGDSVFMGSI